MLYFQDTLQMCLYDEDPLLSDNLISTLQFDISSLTVGKKETKEFIIDPKVKIPNTPLQHLKTCA